VKCAWRQVAETRCKRRRRAEVLDTHLATLVRVGYSGRKVGISELGINGNSDTGRLLSNFLNFIFHGPPGLSTGVFMIVL
jgi:hypothetical protein